MNADRRHVSIRYLRGGVSGLTLGNQTMNRNSAKDFRMGSIGGQGLKGYRSMTEYLRRYQALAILDALTSAIQADLVSIPGIHHLKSVKLDSSNCDIGEMHFWRIDQFHVLAEVSVHFRVKEGGQEHTYSFFQNMQIDIKDGMTLIPAGCGLLDQRRNHSDLWEMTDSLVPVMTRDRIEQGAEAMLAAYCPETLGNQMMNSARHMASRMGLNIVKLHLAGYPRTRSILFFHDGTVQAMNEEESKSHHSQTHTLKVPANTIVINTALVHRDHCQMEIYHECVHYYWHYAFYRLQDLRCNDGQTGFMNTHENKGQDISVLEEMAAQDAINEGVAHLGRSPIEWIEWQARVASYALMMPRPFMQVEIDHRLVQPDMEGISAGERWEAVATGIASDYEIPQNRVRIRLIQLGHTGARGALNHIDGIRLAPFDFSAGSGDGVSFVIGRRNLMREYFSNPAFAREIDTGRYLYTEGHVCINTPEFVHIERGVPNLSRKALMHIDECCLRFVSQHYGAPVSELLPGTLTSDEEYTERYYSFVTGGKCMPEVQKQKRVSELLNELPESFHDTLRFLMRRSCITQEKMEELSGISVSTISRLCREERSEYNMDQVVALCIAMKLPPWLSFELLKRAGLILRKNVPQHNAYRMILNCMFYKSLDDIQDYLHEVGFKPLNLKKVA